MTAKAVVEQELARDEILYLPISAIDPDPDQPRLDVDEDLAESIKQHGVLQAIQVRPHPVDADRWMVVDGERRYRGSMRAGAKTIPATITLEVEDVADRLVRQIVRNEGRALTPWEEAMAFKRIIDQRRAAGDKKYGVVQLAAEIGAAKSTVRDRIALADTPAPFVPLFKKGELSAAAAPIVRKFADVPKEIIGAAIKEAREHYEWDDAVRDGRPVPLEVAKGCITREVCSHLWYMSPEVAKRYKGAVLKLEHVTYAIDVAEAERIEAEIRAEEQKRSSAKAAKSESEETDWQREDRERRAREAKALKKKRDERENVFRAVAAKLPSRLEGAWLTFAIGGLLDEMQRVSRQLACKALGVEAPKGGGQYGGADYRKALFQFAESLDDGRRAQLLLQLILLRDTSVSPYDNRPPTRLKAAAELLGGSIDDFKKVTVIGNPLVEAPKTIGATFSALVTRSMTKRELAKTLAQMSNEWLLATISYVKKQLAKFDDPKGWPTDIVGLNTPITGRNGVYLSGADRNEVVADLAQLEKAAERRGLTGQAPDPADGAESIELACKYCGCTESTPCLLGDDGEDADDADDGIACSWHDRSVPVCTKTSCIASFVEDQECAADESEPLEEATV